MEFLLYLFEKRGIILLSALRHMEVSAIAVLLSVVIAIPLGILITRYRKIAHVVVNSANIGQTVPSLAILGLVIPILGIGLKPAVFALVLRGVLPIINNTYLWHHKCRSFTHRSGQGDRNERPTDPHPG